MFEVKSIDHVALTVADVPRSIDWYRDVLGFERRHQEVWGQTPAMMFAGDTAVALFPASGPMTAAPDSHTTVAMRHLAFRVDRKSFLEARKTLAARGIEVSFEDHTIAHSIYFRDPDGYELELTTYELGG